MYSCADGSIRWATLLLIAVSLVISSNRVLHAHAEGGHPHALQSHHGDQISAVAWHAHVHLFGIDVHIPVADEDGLDPHNLPGGMCPSWLDLPTVVDAHHVAAPVAEVSLEPGADAPRARVTPIECEPACLQYSGPSPGRGQRILMASLTL